MDIVHFNLKFLVAFLKLVIHNAKVTKEEQKCNHGFNMKIDF
jgi:hypothetical protein